MSLNNQACPVFRMVRTKAVQLLWPVDNPDCKPGENLGSQVLWHDLYQLGLYQAHSGLQTCLAEVPTCIISCAVDTGRVSPQHGVVAIV